MAKPKKRSIRTTTGMYSAARDNAKLWGLSVEDAYRTMLNDPTYNYRTYYSESPTGKGNAIDHWPDTYKTVYHPTFSAESKYSGKKSKYNPKGLVGGWWINNEFVPAPWQRNRIQFKTGGTIHIKPENRGKFNALKKRTGKTTEELTHSKNPLTRKRAIFAQNARKWNHKKK